MTIIWVALGGACGATFRYLLVKFLSAGALSFPVGTLVANISGSFLIGLLASSFFLDPKMSVSLDPAVSQGPKLFFQTGLLGAFTTFSAFSLETMQLWQAGHLKSAVMNILLNVILCILAVVLGMLLGTAVSTKFR